MKIAIVDDSIKDREYLQKEIQEIFFRRTKNHIEILLLKVVKNFLNIFMIIRKVMLHYLILFFLITTYKMDCV